MSVIKIIKDDLHHHDGDWTLPGFRAVAVQRIGHWCMTHRSWRARIMRPIYRFLFRYVRNHYGIELPWSVRLGNGVIIEHQGGIVIHGLSVIGDGCIIRQGVTLGNRHVRLNNDAPHLGERVNIGAGAKLLGAIMVGDDAVIGANAVVLNDVKSCTTVAGIPARQVKNNALFIHEHLIDQYSEAEV